MWTDIKLWLSDRLQDLAEWLTPTDQLIEDLEAEVRIESETWVD